MMGQVIPLGVTRHNRHYQPDDIPNLTCDDDTERYPTDGKDATSTEDRPFR